jgi:hypothetical protein
LTSISLCKISKPTSNTFVNCKISHEWEWD